MQVTFLYYTLISLILFSFGSFAQLRSVRGSMTDYDTGNPLAFGNIMVMGSHHGTSANRDGKYELKLSDGSYLLKASYIGYVSDTMRIKIGGDLNNINFKLRQTNISLPEITILPGENPAFEIIRKAVKRKAERNAYLESYEFEAYTKGVIKTEEDLKANGGSFSLGLGTSDSSEFRISGIIENQSKGFFKKPDMYKEIILARKQTSNFPSSVNVLTGGRLIQNFYDDEINFMGIGLPGPLSESALNFYDYIIQRTTAIDNYTIYVIYISPQRKEEPGFQGYIYIKDSTYDLIKIDFQLNRAANRGGIFDSINISQQFNKFGNNIYMPADYRLFADANVLSLARFGFELSTILYDYKINPELANDFFDRAVLTVQPDADLKDSVYWSGIQSIPGTEEELTAYQRIDSLGKIPLSFWDEFTMLSTRIKISNNLFITAPLAMYHFNRVEGHTVDIGLFTEDLFDYRLNTDLNLSYGFSDKKIKSDVSASYYFGKFRTTELSIGAYNKLKTLFGKSIEYNELTSTLLALISKYEFRDYYYSKGFDFNLSGEIIPVLRLSAGFFNYTDRNAYINTNFSFFAKDHSFRLNPPIDEVNINEVKLGFTVDFRKYIEDGYYRRRISGGESYVVITGNIFNSNKDWLNSTFAFTKYDVAFRGILNSFNSSDFSFRAYGMYNSGRLPFQNLYALPGNINLISQDFTFRTLNVNEILGEKVITLNVENNLRDEIFRMMKIPYLESAELQLKIFFNAAYSTKDETNPLSAGIEEFKRPFFETGFGLGHILIPLQIEFAWKLNHRGSNNFRIGLNSFLFN